MSDHDRPRTLGDERAPFSTASDPSQTNDSAVHTIKRIYVERLFGRYTYELPGHDDNRDLSKLFIMYGDNGGGKTTLIKLVYHTLSAEEKKGHRSYLAGIRFERLSIELSDTTFVEARRDVGVDSGDYTLSVIRNSKTVASAEMIVDKDTISAKARSDTQYLAVIKALKSLRLRIHYLSDDRNHQGDIVNASPDFVATTKGMVLTFEGSVSRTMSRAGGQSEKKTNVEHAAEKVGDWLLREARSGSIRGIGNVYAVYSQVAASIARAEPNITGTARSDAHSLIEKLGQLNATSKKFARFGLSTPLPVEELGKSLRAVPDQSVGVLYAVLKPYVDSIDARLDALKDVYDLMSVFVDTLNGFYKDKKLALHVDKGITVRAGSDLLSLNSLSSGEQQLLLLLCNAILARDLAKGRTTIFLIDEPELSLNIKWQRKLVRSLLEIGGEKNVQFLMATHSMELLGQHKSHLVRLTVSDDTRGVRAEPRTGEGESDDAANP